MRKPSSHRKGQTLIEFAFVSVLFVFMLGLTFNAILAFCVHQYVSYATFMASRALQASAGTPTAQRQAAQIAFAQLIPGLSPAAVGPSMNFNVYFPKFSQRKSLATILGVQIPSPREGAYGLRDDTTLTVTFNVPLTEGLPVGSELASQFARVQLTAQSSLGREVTVKECQDYMRNRFTPILEAVKPRFGGGNVPEAVSKQWVNMDDTGC